MRLTKIADASEGQNETNKVKTEMAGLCEEICLRLGGDMRQRTRDIVSEWERAAHTVM